MRTARSARLPALAAAVLALACVLVAPTLASASSPAPDATPSYVRDRILVRFRGAPSETDLEIFTGRQFLTFIQYIGLSYPPGLGWYVFRIDDGMDAALVRDLLRKDPMVCNAELVAVGEYVAIGLPDADEAPPCVDLPPSTPPEASETGQTAAGGGVATDRPSEAGHPPGQAAPAAGVYTLLLLSVLLVVGIGAWLGLRPRTRT